MRHLLFVPLLLITLSSLAEDVPRNVYFGDLHVHTKFSFDAYIFGNTTGPDEAYRFARGEPLKHPAGMDIQMDRPLDFYAVTDHAFFLGMLPAIQSPDHPLHNDPDAQAYIDMKVVSDRWRAFGSFYQYFAANLQLDDVKTAWQEIIESANRNYEPGKFTTFIGYEYTTSNPGNLHRNVILLGDDAPEIPFSRLDSLNPEDLWTWMDAQREAGFEMISIPHNSNGSDGGMFAMTKFNGDPIDMDYIDQRMRNEPLIELTQIKGTSETHPHLSPNDPWANFEIFPYQIASRRPSAPHGSYAREAWLNGFKLERQIGGNPYLFGVVAASDTHNSGDVMDESQFVSKLGVLDYTPVARGSVPGATDEDGRALYVDATSQFFGSSGLAATWAQENTRESIFAAFRRKETFATSGSRIKLRFFAGYGLSDDLLSDPNAIDSAYEDGVPMGANLEAQNDGAPSFFVWAMQDPIRAKLQRVQVIKGWIDSNGITHEQVFDAACSDGLEVDPETGLCPWNNATVDPATCTPSTEFGASELSAVWTDPSFDKSDRAFYYARVLENPTCRWSTWDALRAESRVRPTLSRLIQERAWSSPIWILPVD